MQVSVEQTGDLGRKLTVQVPSSEVEGRVSDKMRDLGRQVRLKGFRPGRVPLPILQQRYGQRVRQEVVGELIQESFQQAVVQEKLRPASQPEIDTQTPQPDQDLQFTASFEVLPELADIKVSELEIERVVATVGEEDIDAMIDTLRAQRRTWEDVDRAAGEGDLIFFHYAFEHEQGRFPAEGEERAGSVIGSGAFDEGLEKSLIGTQAGDQREVEITLGPTFREESLAGAKVQAHIRVEKVQQSQLPVIDEEFFASFGVSEGGEQAFREDVRGNMERELKHALKRRLNGQVLERLVDAFPAMAVPQAMVEAEQSVLQQQAQQQLQQLGRDPAEAAPPEHFKAQAERRVRAALLVSEVARHAELKIDGQRVRELINEVAATYENPAAVVDMYYGNDNLLRNVEESVLQEQVVEWVVESAQVKDKTLTFDQVMRPPQETA